MQLILTHVNADFDAIAGILAAYKLFPSATPILPKRLNRNVSEFVMLYKNGLPFIAWDDFSWENTQTITHLILVDTQRIPSPGIMNAPPSSTTIIDHHTRDDSLPENTTFTGEVIGAVTTLLVEKIREQHLTINSLEATLFALGIYEDTGSLTYHATTARDVKAVAWLLEQQADLDVVRRFLYPPLSSEQRILFDHLINHTENRIINGHTISIASAKIDHYIEQINSVAHRISDLLDPSALFIIVQMPNSLQIVCRSRGNTLNVGNIARHFGGGGHPRAAAANIENGKLEDVLSHLWSLIEQHTIPMKVVADLMSYGVQTVSPEEKLEDIIIRLRRIGHEGYPVVENGQLIGLLTRKDADRAVEHQLNNTTVRDVMLMGNIALHPTSSITHLEKLMVESGWGQIPVVEADGRLIGIVTRTDLIKHWADTHPESSVSPRIMSLQAIQKVLGDTTTYLIKRLSEIAQQNAISMYLVGGIVRDLFLQRPNYDIDFVIEGDAIHFAELLSQQFGGETNSYRPFGTAKWKINHDVAQYLHVPIDMLPDHIDFTSSRNEFYNHPTALPTVYNSSIKLDLHRRDFTINTIAIQLSPASVEGHILDFYNGIEDINSKLIRVLHSLSFIDDPTRILRAVRFEQRLGFSIETRTAELITTALPMLQRITGERVRNELQLLLKETHPEQGLLKLQQRGIVEAIHPAFSISEHLPTQFATINEWYKQNENKSLEITLEDLFWHVIMAEIKLDKITDVCERLLFGKSNIQSFKDTAQLIQQPQELADAQTPPSTIYEHLSSKTQVALMVTMLISPHHIVKNHIYTFLDKWRFTQLSIDGNTLKEMGLPPGPEYRLILEKLRSAYLDGKIQTTAEEYDLLDDLIDEAYHGNPPTYNKNR